MRKLILVFLIFAISGIFIAPQTATSTELLRIGNGIPSVVRWRPDSTEIVVSTSTGIRIYDRQLNFLRMIEADNPGIVEWSPDGTKIAAATQTEILIWNADTGEQLNIIPQQAMDISWNPDGTQIAAASAISISIYDAVSGAEINKLPFEQAHAVSIDWNTDGRLAVGYLGETGGATVFVQDNGNTIPYAHELYSYAPQVVWAGDSLIIKNDYEMFLWNPASDEPNYVDFFLAGNADMGAFAVNPIDFQIAGVVQSYPIAPDDPTGGVWIMFADHPETMFDNRNRTILSMDWSSDGETIAFADFSGLRLLNATDLTLSAEINDFGTPDVVWSQGNLIYARKNNCNLDLYEAARNTVIGTLPLTCPIDFYRWSPDGNYIAVLMDENTIHVWNVTTQEFVSELTLSEYAHPGIITFLWSPDSTQILGLSGDTYPVTQNLWDVQTGEILEDALYNLPQEERLWWDAQDFIHISINGMVQILGMDGGVIAAIETGITDFPVVSQSHNGRYVAVSYQENTIGIFDVQSGSLAHQLPYERGESIRSLAWSEDDSLLATGMSSGFIYVWNMETRQEIAVFSGHTRTVYNLRWNGSQLLSKSYDGTARLWALTTPEAGTMPTPVTTVTIFPTQVTTTPTTEPTLIPARFQNLVFTDTFDDNRYDWETYQDADVYSNIIDGVFLIEYNTPRAGYAWFVSPGLNDWSKAPIIRGDFEYRIEVNNIITSTGNYRLTLLVGMQNNYADFVIWSIYMPGGTWAVGTRSDHRMVEGTLPPVKVSEDSHIIGLRVEGDVMTLLIDGMEVATHEGLNVPAGSIGFGAGAISGETAKVHAEFDNLVIYQD